MLYIPGNVHQWISRQEMEAFNWLLENVWSMRRYNGDPFYSPDPYATIPL